MRSRQVTRPVSFDPTAAAHCQSGHRLRAVRGVSRTCSGQPAGRPNLTSAASPLNCSTRTSRTTRNRRTFDEYEGEGEGEDENRSHTRRPLRQTAAAATTHAPPPDPVRGPPSNGGERRGKLINATIDRRRLRTAFEARAACTRFLTCCSTRDSSSTCSCGYRWSVSSY